MANEAKKMFVCMAVSCIAAAICVVAAGICVVSVVASYRAAETREFREALAPRPAPPKRPPPLDLRGGVRFEEVPLQTAVEALAMEAKIPLIIPLDVRLTGTITTHLPGVEPLEALRQILNSKGFALEKEAHGIFTIKEKSANEPKP